MCKACMIRRHVSFTLQDISLSCIGSGVCCGRFHVMLPCLPYQRAFRDGARDLQLCFTSDIDTKFFAAWELTNAHSLTCPQQRDPEAVTASSSPKYQLLLFAHSSKSLHELTLSRQPRQLHKYNHNVHQLARTSSRPPNCWKRSFSISPSKTSYSINGLARHGTP